MTTAQILDAVNARFTNDLPVIFTRVDATAGPAGLICLPMYHEMTFVYWTLGAEMVDLLNFWRRWCTTLTTVKSKCTWVSTKATDSLSTQNPGRFPLRCNGPPGHGRISWIAMNSMTARGIRRLRLDRTFWRDASHLRLRAALPSN